MGKQSRRNRSRGGPPPPKPQPREWWELAGVPPPPGAPGSPFDVFKIKPQADGGVANFIILPLGPIGHALHGLEEQKDWAVYADVMRNWLGDAEYDRCVAAIDKYDALLAAPAFDPACGTATEQALAHAGIEPVRLLP